MFSKNKKKLSKRPRQRTAEVTKNKANVFSYRNNRPLETSTHNKISRKISSSLRIFRHLPSILAATAIAISFLYVLSLNSNVNIVSLNSAGQPLLREKNEYQQAAHNLLKNSLLAKTKLTLNTSNFTRAMKSRFPELSEVSVTLPLMGHRPIVEIANPRPVVLLANEQNQLYVIDIQGRALMLASEAKGIEKLQLPTVVDQSTTPVKVGQAVITAQDAEFIAEVMAQLQAKNLVVATLVLPAVANELQLRLEGLSYLVKFNTQTDARQAVGALLAVKQKLEAERITPAEYIDLRVEEKAYYK